MRLIAQEIEEDWLQRMAERSPGWILRGAAAVFLMGLIGVVISRVGLKDRATTNLLLLATGATELYLAIAFFAWSRWLGEQTTGQVVRQRMLILLVIGRLYM